MRRSSISRAICGSRDAALRDGAGDRGGARRAQGRLHPVRQLLHRPTCEGFNQLIDGGRVDILFANEDEIQALAGVPHFETAVKAVQDKVETLVVTRSEKGAIAISHGERAEVPAEPVAQVVDTTGAGDLFAAGFLAGQAQGRGLEDRSGSARSRRPR